MTVPVDPGTGRTPQRDRGGATLVPWTRASEIREFLTSRRARITPEQSGLRTYGGNRRVPGLRREEVALLAGVSVDYYTRLERGKASGVSESVLARWRARFSSTRPSGRTSSTCPRGAPTSRAARRPAPQRIRPSVQRVLDAMTGAPAFVRNGRMDILAANRLGQALYSEMFDKPCPGHPTRARFVFLDPRAHDVLPGLGSRRHDAVAVLRSEAGRDPYDRGLSDLVGELSTQSETFRTRWAKHNVHVHDTGVKRFHHPAVGDLSLTYETMELAADRGLTLFAYTAEVGSRSEDALNLLASLAATLEASV